MGKGNEHILVVDDEADILEIYQMFFTKHGYKVTFFENSISALQAFKDNPQDFDLIITDMTMPHMTGDKLAARILEIRKDIPIILCTGFTEAISKDQAISMGIRAFISKPLAMDALCQTIRTLLDKR
jgi:DNA-binding NtrC family response regulator